MRCLECIAALALVGCTVPPTVAIAQHDQPRPLRPDNCGTPDSPKVCVAPFTYRPPVIVPVWAIDPEPLAHAEQPPEGAFVQRRPNIKMSAILPDGKEVPFVPEPATERTAERLADAEEPPKADLAQRRPNITMSAILPDGKEVPIVLEQAIEPTAAPQASPD